MSANKTDIKWRQYIRLFTVIELLIVTAIISVLIAILLPALKLAKGKASEIKCAHNLKQIHVAFSMYLSDNQDYFPVSGAYYWMEDILPYVWLDSNNFSLSRYCKTRGVEMIYHCPSATANDSWSGSLYSYAINEHLHGDSHPTSSYWYIRRMTRVYYPNECLFNTDASYPQVYYAPHCFSYRHGGGANISFLDGHCLRYSLADSQDLFKSANDRSWYGRDSHNQ